MKFWHKIYLGALILVTITFDIGAFVLVDSSYESSLAREQTAAMREQAIIYDHVCDRIRDTKKAFPGEGYRDERIGAVVKSMSAFYEKQGIKLDIYLNGRPARGSVPEFDADMLSYTGHILNQNTEGGRYLFYPTAIDPADIALESESDADADAPVIGEDVQLILLYAKDITQLDTFRSQMIRVFLGVSVGITLALAIVMFMMVRYITKPIRDLRDTASQIASGDYDQRVVVRSHDELGELGNAFNQMADSVSDTMSQLKYSAQQKQELIDNLAHELRTPLTSILGYSQFMQQAKAGTEAYGTAAGHLHDSALRLKRLSESLLEMTHLRNNNMPMQQVDVASLFDSLSTVTGPVLEQRGIKLVCGGEGTINGNEPLLLSLLTNLTENAARASTEGETVYVQFLEEEHPILRVVDNGCGMDEAELERITEPFYCVDKSRSRQQGGVGLGLSLCVQIAQLHDATVDFQSKPGVGTIVNVHFTTPLQADSSTKAALPYTGTKSETSSEHSS